MECNEVGKGMTLLLDPDFVRRAKIDGEPAAMMIALPNVNEAVRDLDRHLPPLGWAKPLWRLKEAYPRPRPIPLLGVHSQYHRSCLGPTLAVVFIDALREPVVRRGIREVEMS